MAFGILMVAPLAITITAASMRNNLHARWPARFAMMATAIFALSVPATLSGILSGDWRAIFAETTNLVALTSAWDSVRWLKEHPSIKPKIYFLWWSLFWESLLIISLSQNLALSWLALEFSTVASAALIVEVKDDHSLEAAWKYVVIASVGLIFGLIGIVFVYASLRYQGLGWSTLDYANLQIHGPRIAPAVRQLATIFIVCGLGTKAGLAPFHAWLPDAHSEAPPPVSGLLSGILLGLSLFTIARFIGDVPTTGELLSGHILLEIFGAASIVIGSLALFGQHEVKRLLAYSSIEQMGMIAASLGIGSRAAFLAAALQFIFHAVVKSGLFYTAGHLSVTLATKKIDEMTNLLQRSLPYSILWAIGLLALAGVPPLGIAYSEWLIVSQMWAHHAYILIAITAAALTLAFAALSRVLIRTLWAPAQEIVVPGAGQKLPTTEVI